jgi:hypothetical protein
MQLRVNKSQKSATVILSANNPFAQDELIEEAEFLRVRGCFALRSSHSAKGDSRFRAAGLIVHGEESSGEARQSAQ